MYKEIVSLNNENSRRCSLPMGASDVGEERRLPPLPQILPLPSRGPFKPDALIPTTPRPQDTFQFKSPWAAADHIVAPPSPANPAESS
ncbi:hypothetical protein N7449_004991 [Penicillium cf. viridicatum]|uniref:Uncharacterized protein n=1 Tax=Penicillium cf. viridicatum TaxID=2972119 RepID=A0A9W9MKN5_9EURO|nr:hypothetical protein N7449_004991 [Penicillium cf. viridicatum]